MRILLDENIPRRLKFDFSTDELAREKEWRAFGVNDFKRL
jgi:predicted nuclease of predicted toxin-antitoxin system